MPTRTNTTSPAAAAILKACHWAVLTPSALDQAAAVLDDLWAAGARHGLETGELDLAGQVLIGLGQADRRREPETIDPAPLVLHAARTAAGHLGLAVDDLVTEYPAANPTAAWAVLRRQPRSPAWGPYGSANLMIVLSREDEGRGHFGPWRWQLAPESGAPVTSILAPPPTLTVAAEVGHIVAQALTGQHPHSTT